MNTELTSEQVRLLLGYCSTSGVFTWLRKPCKAIHAGSVAGGYHPDGYIVIRIDGRLYKAHRLAWLHFYGEWPSLSIDHINGQRSDNRIANLRYVTHQQNMENRRVAHKGSKTGLLGVHLNYGRFVARIRVKGALKHLGSFSSANEAHQAYVDAKRIHHPGSTL